MLNRCIELALQVAAQCHRTQVATLLRDLRNQDPAQKVIWNSDGLQIWLGSKEAAYPGFATELGECLIEAHRLLNIVLQTD